ncbi:Polyribonucleotide nucleotidyltransferase [Wickerhamomyces ciferrii]|uniref:Polyribonucleotide nucleotidyltransferase n=1 Tax=Wickerhamomyces ciferrii (strain ATCC 14091 / BCRC 22168 / CBS 111 / JCM 3599 / NBRC 0793 / NRRL Y-1031 F-60-10) TaxID=1206466 RepID=K0KM12_WICCF|nr:Polyribonucleotide nucleotidyltransferase [Wickerhamomyces ciferrii]CCH42404.1 Polyribonucleotide nucleotidyltransferase [Wickerhamomyces ciferrii]
MTLESETTILNRVDGSASLDAGETKVISSVSGPIEPKARQELPTTSALEVIIRADIGVSNTREKLLEDKLRAILSQVIIGHLFPRQLIQITSQVLESGEDREYTSKELSAIVNSSYLALIDANIGLSVSFAAQDIAITESGELIAGPTKEQLRSSKSSHVVVYAIENGEPSNILFSDSIGTFTEDEVYRVLAIAKQHTGKVHQKFRKTLQEKVEKDFVWSV